MSYPCRMTDPFLPIYDFDALENEPDPVPAAQCEPDPFSDLIRGCFGPFGYEEVPDLMQPTLRRSYPVKTIADLLLEARGIHFDPVNYGCIAISVKDFK